MQFDYAYYHHGVQRWDLGFVSPNHGAAFLVMVLCLFWALAPKPRFLFWAGLLAEGTLLYMLGRTGSRGALVALFAALVVFLLLTWRRPGRPLVLFAIRMSGYLVILSTTNIFSRAAMAMAGSDGSTGNRLEVWKGGLMLFASAPITGWGPGSSGNLYINWIQEIPRKEVYSTLVNGFLTISVEHGMLGFFAVCFALAFLWRGGALVGKRDTNPTIPAAVAALVAWAVANCFTTLYRNPVLLGCSGAISLWLLYCICRSEGAAVLAKAAAWTGVAAAACANLVGYGSGLWLIAHQAAKCRPGKDGLVCYEAQPARRPAKIWYVWADPAIFGPYPGKVLRSWANATIEPMRIFANPFPIVVENFTDQFAKANVLLAGRQVGLMVKGMDGQLIDEIWLVHPTVAPPLIGGTNFEARRIHVVLPAIDEEGCNAAWIAWAEGCQAEVVFTPQSGLDLAGNWRRVLPI